MGDGAIFLIFYLLQLFYNVKSVFLTANASLPGLQMLAGWT